MNNELQKLTTELSKRIGILCCDFFAEKLNDEENVSDVMNLTISSHMTSLFNLMNVLSEPHPKTHKKVAKFIEDITHFLSNQESINSVDFRKK